MSSYLLIISAPIRLLAPNVDASFSWGDIRLALPAAVMVSLRYAADSWLPEREDPPFIDIALTRLFLGFSCEAEILAEKSLMLVGERFW